jgi:TldD protein
MIIERLVEAISRGTADYLDIRYQVEDSSGFGYRKGQPDGASVTSVAGGVVRACIRGGWGAIAFDSLDRLDQAVADAYTSAALVGTGTTQIHEQVPIVSESRATFLRDFRGISIDDKIDLIRRYDDLILRLDDQIESSGVGYQDFFTTVYTANSFGTAVVQEIPQAVLSWHTVARDGSLVQRTHDSLATASDYDMLTKLEHKLVERSRRAVDLFGYVAPDDHLKGRTKAIHAARDQKRAQARERRKHYSQNKHAA